MKTVSKIVILAIITILLGCSTLQKELSLSIQNSSSSDRENEIVEFSWTEIQNSLALLPDEKIIVTDEIGQQVPYQLVTNGTGKVESLIFSVSVNAGQEVEYKVSIGEPEEFEPLVYGRLVPERKDDFAWENNRTAFRIYGPALKATGEISNGMDFWAKKTENLIIDKWYKNDLAGIASYHTDNGEGLDFYKVGRTLGLGMTAPVDNDTLCLGDNFVTAEILDNGPLRITFKLTYDPYFSGENKIVETRIISLDAYSLLNKVTNIFETDNTTLTLATGIVMPEENPLENAPNSTYGDNSGIIAYETPQDKVNGTVYTAAINPIGYEIIEVSGGHYLGFNSYKTGTEYTYYTGGGWSKAGFNSFEEWVEFLKKEKQKINEPLKVNISQ